MHDFENELEHVLDTAPDRKAIIIFVKSKVLESYRNGLSAGKNPPKRNTGAWGQFPA